LIPKDAHITSVFRTLILVVVVITVNARFMP